MKRLILIPAGLLLLAGPATADVTMNWEMRDLKKREAETSTGLYQIADHNVAVVITGTSTSRMIFLGEKDLLYIIDDKDKSYMEADKATLESLGKQMDEAAAQIEAEMARMSPEQRKQMEKMMGGMMKGSGAGQPKEYSPMPDKKPINGFDCRRVDVTTGAARSGELWVTDVDALKISAADYQTFLDMGQLFEKFARGGQKLLSALNVPVDDKGKGKGPGGFPVLTRLMNGDKVTNETELKLITHGSVDPAVFHLPEGYKKKDFPK